MIIKILKRAVYSTVIILVLIASLLAFLLYTKPGLHAALKLSELFIPGTIKVERLEGRLWDKFTIGELNYQNALIKVKAYDVHINWDLRSLLHRQITLHQLIAEQIELKPKDATVRTIKKFKLAGQVGMRHLQITALQFNHAEQNIKGRLETELKLPYALTGRIDLNAQNTNSKVVRGSMNINGDFNVLTWDGEFSGPAAMSIKGSLKQFMQLELITKWRDIQWQNSSKSIFKSPEGKMKITGTLPRLNIEFYSKLNGAEGNWQLNANIHGTAPWQWNFNAQLTQPQAMTSSHPGFYTSLGLTGKIDDINHANLELTINPGHYQMPEKSMLSALAFTGGVLNVVMDSKKLSGNGYLAIDDNKKLNLKFALLQFDLSKGVSDKQAVSANLALTISSLDFLQELTPEIKHPHGSLTASINATGTLAHVMINSNLFLNKGSVGLPKLGLDLHDMNLKVLGKGDHWEATGSLSSANQAIKLQGQGPLSSELSGELSLQGANFPIINTKEYQIHLSPQLNIKFTPANVNVSGKIMIPFAQIKPQTFSNSLAVSEDIVFKNAKEKTTPASFNMNMDIAVEMGEEVELTAKGLHATLAGMVHLKQIPQGPVTAAGELSVKKGEYKAYGQDLLIEHGQLIFAGGRLDNPGINLRASKNIETSSSTLSGSNQLFDFNTSNLQNTNLGDSISVGVEVGSRLSNPKITLFSNPAILSQADILSMLVLGRPASQANKAGAQLLLTALTSMDFGSGTNGTQMLEQLKKSLGVDFNLQTNSVYNQSTNQVTDSTGLVVGKSLSKRIYLSYNVGLSQDDPNVLTMKYLLNKFLSIQVTSSTSGNGVDFFYTSHK